MNGANDAPAIQTNGSSNWVSKVPVNYELNKNKSFGIVYKFSIPGLPANALVVKTLMYITFHPAIKAVFITMRHNEVRNTTATFFSDDCKDVEVKPSLTKLRGYEQQLSTTAKTQDDGRFVYGEEDFGSGDKEHFLVLENEQR